MMSENDIQNALEALAKYSEVSSVKIQNLNNAMHLIVDACEANAKIIYELSRRIAVLEKENERLKKEFEQISLLN